MKKLYIRFDAAIHILGSSSHKFKNCSNTVISYKHYDLKKEKEILTRSKIVSVQSSITNFNVKFMTKDDFWQLSMFVNVDLCVRVCVHILGHILPHYI